MERDPLDVKREGESLLLAGTQYGYLILLDPSDGSVKYSVRAAAHDSAVSLIRCNPKKNQVITASQGTGRNGRIIIIILCNNYVLE
jgi:hypothetical protein